MAHQGQQFGPYRVSDLLGHGGFADVYLGEHIYLKTEAAVKVMHGQCFTTDRASFLTEARTLSHLVHPHIVPFLYCGIEGETPFLVMAYAPHGTLLQRHPRGSSRIPLATVALYVKQIASALHSVQRHNLIHGDVKPENMLIGPSHEVWISDFGHCREALGRSLAERSSDQYALGITVHEWLSGEARPVNKPPLPLREKLPLLSLEVDAVVMKALAKDPQERFVDIQTFATAFERASLMAGNFAIEK